MSETPKTPLSAYHTIACLNESHKIYLVQHAETRQIYVKKILDIFNKDIYLSLAANPIPGIPKIVALYLQEEQLIVIENYVSGQTLSEILKQNRLTSEQICSYGIELCNILNQLHSMNPPIIHRDIKPSNIIITEHGHVVLLDFNAAKHYNETSESDTILLGTKGYAAPEQYGFGSSTPKTDIYALGILLKELSTSVAPVPPKLQEIIEQCIQMNPNDRYQSVAKLRQDLEQIISPDESSVSRGLTIASLLPPGFRTLTPWKMGLSAIVYSFITWFCLTIEIKNVTGIKLWLERFTLYFISLSLIFEWFNYLNIQKLFPPCGHRNKFIRVPALIFFNLITMFVLLFVLCIIEISFFN